MSYVVDYADVFTFGLESSPVAEALAGLRANEARYFKNKYSHTFTVEPASEATEAVDWVHRILVESAASSSPRDHSRQRPSRSTASGWRTSSTSPGVHQRDVHDRGEGQARCGVQALRRDGGTRGARHAFQVREAEVEAGRNDPRLLLRH